MILTYRYRIKDRSARKTLKRHAWAVNQVWNYCVAQQRDVEARYRAGAPKRRWASTFDLHKLTSGTSRELGVHAGTINEACRIFVQSRDLKRRAPKFRSSSGSRRALGWVPFRAADRTLTGNTIKYLGKSYRIWLGRRPFPESGIKSGCFVEDAQGRWYLCLAVEIADKLPTGTENVGIDLGLKAAATCSNGMSIAAPRIYRKYEHSLAVASRAHNKRRIRALHAKIKNCRKDFIHKATTQIARENALIAVGNVSSSQLAKTRMAKSVLDAGWSMFRNQLRYKASRHGAVYLDIDEKFTTRVCSCCGVISDSSPKGMSGLGIRAWECSSCGEIHDRDVNAARNILALALSAQRPAGGSRDLVMRDDRISTLWGSVIVGLRRRKVMHER